MTWVEWKKQHRRPGTEMDPRWWQVVLQRQSELRNRPAVTPEIDLLVENPVPDTWYRPEETVVGDSWFEYWIPPWADVLWIRLLHSIEAILNDFQVGPIFGYLHDTRLLINDTNSEAGYVVGETGVGTTKPADRPVEIVQDVRAWRGQYKWLSFQSRMNISVARLHIRTAATAITVPRRAWRWATLAAPPVPPMQAPPPGAAPEAAVLIVSHEDELPAPSYLWRDALAIIRPPEGSGRQGEQRKCLRGYDDVYRWQPFLVGGGPF
jgi:hypothetical protein